MLYQALGDVEVDVSFQQRQADLAKDLVNIGLGQLASTPEAAEDAVETISKRVKHGRVRVAPVSSLP